MSFVVIIAAGAVAYGPPSNQSAYQAFTDEILVEVQYSGDYISEQELRSKDDFPSAVNVVRCIGKSDRKVRISSGRIAYYDGYDCAVEVLPNGEAPYRTFGFFRHNGLQWEYHGPMRASRQPKNFGSPRNKDPVLEKPGALEYEGDPRNPFNEGYNPYRDHFETFERVEAEN